MNTPPLLVGAALLFWGWQSGLIVFGALAAIILETPRFVRWRWDFTTADLRRVWYVCSLLFVGAAAYCYVSLDTTNELMEFFLAANFTAKNKAMTNVINTFFYFQQWWPLIFLPIALAQALGNAEKIPYSVFSWYMRRKAQRDPGAEGALNIGFVYFALVLVATSVTNRRDPSFYAGLTVLLAWALWSIRPRRVNAIAWVGLLLLLATIGYWGQARLHLLQSIIEGGISQWIARLAGARGDGLISRTAIGRIGQLKLSGKILMRIDIEDQAPALLRDSSFNMFDRSLWFVPIKEFGDVFAETDSTTWNLMPAKTNSHAISVSRHMDRSGPILSVPSGTFRLQNLIAGAVKTNKFGVIQVEESPGFVRYRATFGGGKTVDAPPDVADTFVNEHEMPAVRKIVNEMSWRNLPDTAEKIRAVEAFFQQNFVYSTYQTIKDLPRDPQTTALANFLLNTRKGHCEYFGTATVLLLRELGVPARYANGYSLQETRQNGRQYIVRERHAHAWCIYWDAESRAWKDLDTTPASWLQDEEQNASLFEPISDFFSWLRYRFAAWRWLGERGSVQKYLGWALLVLVVILIWRLFVLRKRATVKGVASANRIIVWPGADSEFYLVEKRLRALGLERFPGEGFTAWLARLDKTSTFSLGPLREVLKLHYRYRFDPHGINAAEREALRAGVESWLAAQDAAKGR
ncbi:MAG: transglutaminase domain-containing protein [Verrucomicrobiota bacterium]